MDIGNRELEFRDVQRLCEIGWGLSSEGLKRLSFTQTEAQRQEAAAILARYQFVGGISDSDGPCLAKDEAENAG